jgi:hypothetical protein
MVSAMDQVLASEVENADNLQNWQYWFIALHLQHAKSWAVK